MLPPQPTGAEWGSAYHVPVLAAEVLALLDGAREILDGTLGGGGHTHALLERGVRVTALDRDPDAIAAASERLRAFERAGRFQPILGNFADIDDIGALAGARFDGILLDLGVSSHQLDDPARGFSFREGAPLDMRMGADAP
ncbi:MAG TPA: 16S rRNA (cytosine(1402)-N(4))-methyltransferase, partial [Gemmatimonadaceae bacterium]